MSKGWHIMHEKRDGFTIYFGNQPGARFISFHFPLHNGWKSSSWLKGGFDYYQPAILTGRLAGTNKESKWHMLPEFLVPAKAAHLWRMRRKTYRTVWNSDNHGAVKKPKSTPDSNTRDQAVMQESEWSQISGQLMVLARKDLPAMEYAREYKRLISKQAEIISLLLQEAEDRGYRRGAIEELERFIKEAEPWWNSVMEGLVLFGSHQFNGKGYKSCNVCGFAPLAMKDHLTDRLSQLTDKESK